MTLEYVYGSRPDLLPRSMVQLVRAGEQDSRRTAWVGREGVRILDFTEHIQSERHGIGYFPRKSDGSIEWNEVDGSLVVWSAEEDSIDLEPAIQRFVKNSRVLVIIWSSVTIPSVEVSSEAILSSLVEIVASESEFWICSAQEGRFLERAFSGLVTIATMPEMPAGRDVI